MPCSGSRKCFNCQQYFIPHPRSKETQRFCADPVCRKASKQFSQRKWLSKPQNKGYFAGPDQVSRVQRWRTQNPGYWKAQPEPSHCQEPLQDLISIQPADSIEKYDIFTMLALQDVLMSQPFVLLGLIAQLTGTTLQDDIAATVQRLQQFGEDLLHTAKPSGVSHATSVRTQPATSTPGTRSVQLDRSPPGA